MTPFAFSTNIPTLPVLPLLALPDAHTPEFIGALAAQDESRAHPDTTRKTRS
jgi:hypothetical protein